LRGINL